jgi:Pectate lyase superfamily protein
MKLALILAVFLASFALVETSRAQSSSSTSSTGTVEAIAIAGGSAASNVAGATYAVQTAPPVIFNVSSNAQAGDIISIQGTNFDITTQIWLGGPRGNSATQLAVVNKVGVEWIAAQTPQAWSGAMILWISNSSGVSKSVALNGAMPWNLDALQLVPGGAFKVLGQNLLLPGYRPSVTVDGQTATIDIAASSVNMLVVTAPVSIRPTSNAVITVDNGNGTGPVRLDRTINVVSGSGDPFGLGIGWAAGFTFAGNVIPVSTHCDGTQDDSANIQSAINAVPSSGGVVQLPAGNCLLVKSLTMRSHVVLQGRGKNVTFLRYESNYPIRAMNLDLVGLRNLTLANTGSAVQGPWWTQNSRSFLQNVTINMGFTHQLSFTQNRNFIVTLTDFLQEGSLGETNPYLFGGCSGFVFSNNTSTSVDGSPTFGAALPGKLPPVHDALILNNHFTRNAANQNESPVIATHMFVMDFAYRMAIIGNTWDVTNGPITNIYRNDGETLLTEGGGGNRTENEGTVASATINTITDPNNTINVNPFGTGLPENYGVAIVSGTGAGQNREVISYSNSTMQVDHPWDVIPNSTSHYATFVWGLEKTLIEGNTLIGNPRGIWLYQSATRDVDISNNTITNGGGIYLRAEQQSVNGVKQFDPMYNVRIQDNTISNDGAVWMSYVASLFVIKDKANFGTADTGVEIRNNSLTANTPNVTTSLEDRVTQEGFMNLMYSEVSGGQLRKVPMVLGTIFQGNSCLNCNTAFVIGTGDYGIVLVNNQSPPRPPNFLADWRTLGSANPASIGTIIH